MPRRLARPTLRWLAAALSALCLAGIVAARAGAAGADLELVMFVEAGCPWCARWDREVGPGYANSPEGRRAPLRKIDISEARRAGLELKSAVTVTPTFVLVQGGREIGRITGYPGADFFWGFVDELLQRAGPERREPPPPRDARLAPARPDPGFAQVRF